MQLLRIAYLKAGSIRKAIPTDGIGDIFFRWIDSQDPRAAVAFSDRKR
jgi:hypothetical protein